MIEFIQKFRAIHGSHYLGFKKPTRGTCGLLVPTSLHTNKNRSLGLIKGIRFGQYLVFSRSQQNLCIWGFGTHRGTANVTVKQTIASCRFVADVVILVKAVGLGVWHMIMNINNNSPKPNKKAEESKAIKSSGYKSKVIIKLLHLGGS